MSHRPHSGICTECGVCDDEEEAQEHTEEGGGSGRGFGRNVVYEPPPIPEFEGHYRPNSTRAQRLRFRFSKTGDMVFVGHLDLIKTFDRACRRAALPISADESPFAVRQRIYAALPLPLGATSAGEWLEITLTERFEPEAIRSRLQAQLPGGLELLSAEEALVKKADGSNGEKMAQQLDSVEYYLVLDDQEADAPSSSSSSSSGGGSSPLARLTTAVAGALATPEFVVERSGGKKRGKKLAPTKVDLKWALQEMQACTPAAAAAGGVPAEVLPAASSSKAVVRVRTACANGNPVITPAMAIDMLNAAAAAGSGSNSSSTAAAAEAAAAAAQDGGDGSSDAAATSSGRYALAHLHRSEIRLRPMTVPQPDWAKLRSLVRMEGHLAAAQVSGSGPWASGLENRPRLE